MTGAELLNYVINKLALELKCFKSDISNTILLDYIYKIGEIDPTLIEAYETPEPERAIPMLAVGADELKEPITEDTLVCPHCGETHDLRYGTDAKTGKETKLLQFYNCGKESYLYGIGGKKLK